MTVDLITEVPDHLSVVLKTLQELQRRLDTEMNSGLAGSAGAGVNPAHVRMGVQLSTASAQLGREVRAWTKRVKELAKSAPLEERLEAVRRFIQELSPADRERLLEDLDV